VKGTKLSPSAVSKQIYRTTGVKAANWEWIAEQARTVGPVVYGVDAAKEGFVGAVAKHIGVRR
jgi:hypothetical protein